MTIDNLILTVLLCSIYNLNSLPTSSICTRKPADVVFILDSSSSIKINNFNKQRDFVNEVVEEFNIGPNADQTRVGVLTFGHDVWRKFDLKDHLDLRSLKDAVSKIKYEGAYETRTADAINFAVTEMFNPEAGSREDVTRIAIVITDGRSHDTIETKLAALRAHESDVFVFAIGVGRQVVTEELKSIASDPEDEFMFNITDFTTLSSITQKLAAKTCAVSSEGEECEGKPADVFFLIDASGSINRKNFTKELDFVEKVVDEFDISQSTSRVGLLSFSSNASITLELNNNLSKKDLIKKIQGLEYTGDGTNTADALRKVRQHGYASGIARPDVAQIVVLLTDGGSDNKKSTKREANLTHMAGIKVFSIGIGTEVNIVELRDVAGDPDIDYVFLVDDFGSLDSIKKELAVKTCRVKSNFTKDHPSGNPGTNAITNTTTPATTTPVYTTTTTKITTTTTKLNKECEGKPADVFFLIDASGSIGTNDFSKELDFVEKVVDEFDISKGTTRVGILTFDASALITFELNNNLSKKDLIKKIQGLEYTGGGTNTADALRMVRQHGYASGIARPHVAQIVVLLTDGKSDDDKLTKREAKLTHMAGIKVFSIGIGTGVGIVEMRDTASDPDENYVFLVDDFASLESIKTELAVKTCGVKLNATDDTPSVCEVLTNTDLMFIYDTASLGRYKSRAISQFLAVVVSYFDLTTGFLQVGRVTDNCPSGENFPLSNKVSAADFSKIRYSAYSHLIKKVRKSGFSVDNNGRVDSSKVAVLFVDSKKTDAKALKEAKAMTKTAEVFIVTIGKSRKVDKFVGQFMERNIIQVNSYAYLKSASTQIFHKMCFFLENNGDKDYTIDYVIPV